MKDIQPNSFFIFSGQRLRNNKIAFLFTILTTIPAILIAQDQDTLLIKGKVIDSKNQNALAFAHLIKNDTTGYITDENGNFIISLTSEDTLHISHISHKEQKLSFNEITTEKEDTLTIALQPQSYFIEAVTIRPLGTYGEFKQEFLKLNTRNKNEKHASNNVKHLPMLPPKTKEDPTKSLIINEQVSGPPSVTIFSTSRDKGIIGFINALMKDD